MKPILLSLLIFHASIASFAIPGTIIENIHIDQFGYRCSDQKIAVISSAVTGYYGSPYSPGTGTNQYEIRNWTDDGVVFSGTLSVWNAGATQTQSGDQAWWFDFSTFSMPGNYYIYDLATGKASYEFTIDNQVYAPVLKQAMRSYFYQRCGAVKATPFAGVGWTDVACHQGSLQDLDCRLYSNTDPSTSKNLSGGWHDAGDYNKYVGFTIGAVTDLLLAYSENPLVWTDDYNIPESGNGIPDILDEVKYELDWLLKMQQSDGSVLSIVGTANFPTGSPPSTDIAQRLYGPATTNASFVMASDCALAAVQFITAGNLSYAATLQNAAVNAYNWGLANPAVTFYNTGIIAAGEQEVGAGSYDLFARQLMAAVFLFKLTGNSSYQNFVESNYQNIHLVQWGFAYPFETTYQDALLYYAGIPGVSVVVKNNILSTYTSSINTNNTDNLPAFLASTDAYRAYLSDQNYTDGSNMTKGHQGLMFTNMAYYNLNPANNTDYNNAASGFLHYMHGVNPTGFCFLTNMGPYGSEKSVPEFYNGWFTSGSPLWDRVGVSTYGPAPGYVPGGPNPGYSTDACCATNSCGSAANNSLCNPALVTPPLSQPIQKSYKDFNTNWPQDSWTVSENGIYYEAAYVKLLSKFIDTSTCTSLILLSTPLINFNAVFVNTGTVKASWKMGNEDGVASYVVEKSTDGIRFDSIGSLPNSNSNQYALYDYDVKAPVNYYRLSIINNNGSLDYSNIVILKETVNNQLDIFPNPSKGQLTVSYANFAPATQGTLSMIDIYGHTVYEQQVIIETGSNHYALSLSQLAGGVYYLCLKDNDMLSITSSVAIW